MNAISDGGEEGLVREEDEAPTKETDSSLPSREGGGGGSCGDSCEGPWELRGGGDISRLH